jgi:hypothetical protein
MHVMLPKSRDLFRGGARGNRRGRSELRFGKSSKRLSDGPLARNGFDANRLRMNRVAEMAWGTGGKRRRAVGAIR